MAGVQNVTLQGEIINSSKAKLTIGWRSTFRKQEVMAGMVFIYRIYIQNVDGLGDPDVRRRHVSTAWDQAKSTPINREITVEVDRDFLNEDFQVLGFGDKTDEWVAEVKTFAFKPSLGSAKSSELTMKFGVGE